MKRIFGIITIILASLALSPRAFAESAYFGVRADIILPLGVSNTSLSIPLPGIQVGYDFGTQSEPGFGVRGTLNSLIFVSKISVDALYRIPTEPSGAGWYVGAGADALIVLIANVGPAFGAHAVAGYNFALSDSLAAFLEVSPGAFFSSGTSLFSSGASLGTSLFYVSFAAGINFRL
jgi:hypothetical protein